MGELINFAFWRGEKMKERSVNDKGEAVKMMRKKSESGIF